MHAALRLPTSPKQPTRRADGAATLSIHSPTGPSPKAKHLDFHCTSVSVSEARRLEDHQQSVCLPGCQPIQMDAVGNALKDVLRRAKRQRTITIGVYEAAKLLNVDPDNVVLCLLAADETDDQDVALQIHFTLIQAFCCENDISILRVSNTSRLAEILGASDKPGEPADLHCILISNLHPSHSKDSAMKEVIGYCKESRYRDQWVPVINLPER
uniref:Growth arrest and DNA damage-inducible protein GADD45 alpha n=1 Tax=Leptobrachium leishanense TaxID=445787 RepID=A0A8C5QHZ8_9ANUR